MLARYFSYVLISTIVLFTACLSAAEENTTADPIPVIYDTDLGEDIDDAWALAFLAKSPELELKLVTTGFGNAGPKAKMAAKILAATGQSHVPIAAGKSTGYWAPKYVHWADDFNPADYEGPITGNGVKKLVQTIMNDETGRLKVLAVGPLQNIAAALKREPEIVEKVDELIAMSGSVRRGYGGKNEVDAESNVRCEIGATQQVYQADWNRFTIAPLDTAGTLRLKGDRYKKVFNSELPGAETVIKAYKRYVRNREGTQWKQKSTTLYDTLAVYLAWSSEFVKIEKLPLTVTDKGITKIDRENGSEVYAAMEWEDKDAFKDLLIQRLTTYTRPRARTGPDRVVDNPNGNGNITVKLDGSRSVVSAENDRIKEYIWTENGRDIAQGARPEVDLSPGPHLLKLRIDEQGGSDTDTVSVFVNTGLPEELKTDNIGAVEKDGGGWCGGGVYRVAAAGRDIWKKEDAFHYVYRPVKGDAQITVRIMAVQQTHPWAKAGVMIREKLKPDSKNAMMAGTAGQGTTFQFRSGSGDKTQSIRKNVSVPCYLRLTRKKNTFTASVSQDGEKWEQVGSQELPMSKKVYAGLAVTSHNAGLLTNALFDDVSVVEQPDE